MFTYRPFRISQKTLWFSWQFLAIKLMLLALLAVWLEKPSGSLEGHISLEMKGFHMQTYDMKGNHVYALVNGPRGSTEVERAAWVRPDGTFKIDHLPVGEYNLRVRARGFETYEESGLFVEEGKVASMPKNIAMHILNPSVTIGQHSRTYTSAERPELYFNTTGAIDGTVKIYKTDIMSLLRGPAQKQIDWSYDLAIAKNADAKFVNPLAKLKPSIERQFKLEQDYTDWSRAEVHLDDDLAPGDYVAYVQVNGVNGKADDIAWFTISDVGLVIKRDSDVAIARAVDLVTFKPVSNCKIETWDQTSRTKQSGPFFTGADGVVRIPLRGTGTKVTDKNIDLPANQLLFIGTSGQQHTYGEVAACNENANPYDTYFYTERPVYRLGQTVYYKGMIRKNTTHGYSNPGANLVIDAAVENPDNNEVWHGKLTTSSHGTFHGSFAIPPDDKTGGYQVRLTFADGSTGFGSFEVDEYRKPEYQVDMTPLTPRVVMGDKGQAKLHAAYYFGAPVANATVKYTITVGNDWFSRIHMQPRPSYYSYFDDWDGGGSDSYGGGEQVAEGTATTDANGDAIITFDTKVPEVPSEDGPTYYANYSDKKYNVQATVTDISRLTVDSGTSVSAVPGDFVLFVNPGSYVAQPGDKLDVAVLAEDYDGKPVASQSVRLTTRRWIYDRIKNNYRSEQVADVNVTTDAQGKANVSMYVRDQWPSDQFYISAYAQDKEHHSIRGQGNIWVANYRYPYVAAKDEAETQALSIKLDKDVYKVGDVARAMISAPVTGKEGADAIVTVEGERLYNYKVTPMNATAKLIEIPITAEYAPNVYIDVALIGNKHQFYTAEEMIKVSPEDNFLNIKIASDKERYHPGDKAQYTLTATHKDGTPAPNTELSLGIVDESIYAIRAEAAADICKFFYSRRGNRVQTACSFPQTYTGGPDKIEPRVRKDFKDTAAWLPDLVTDKDGKVTTEVKLPDNLTTWRATVRGIDMKTSVGASVSKIISTQDFILRLGLPRFYSQGDEALITAIVHNYTKQKQSVTVSVSTSDIFKFKEKKTQVLEIDPEKASRYSWPVTVMQPGTAVISAKAIGQTAGDAMEVKLPVRPLGLPAFSVKSGLLTEDKQTVEIPVGLSADADKSTVKGKLTLASSTIGPVLGNFDQLIEYPYGCTEQTMSRLMPSIVAMQLHKQLNVPMSDDIVKKFAKVQKISLEKLAGYHHPDGGWGWWATDDSNPYLTCYVVQGLSMLKASDYKVDDAFITGGMSWLAKTCTELQRQFKDPHRVPDQWLDTALRTDLARMVYTLGLWDATPEDLAPPAPPKPAAAKTSTGANSADAAKKAAAADPSAPNPAPHPTPIATPAAKHVASAGKAIKKKAKLTYSLGPDLFVPLQAVTSGPARPSKVRQFLVENIKVLSPEALTYLTLACRKLNDNDGADKAYKRLTALANSGAYVNWEHSREMMDKFDSKSRYSEYDYRFTGVESTALALQAVMTMEPDNHDKIESIKQWLLWQRDNNGWENTKTTAEVFIALLQEELQFKSSKATSFTLDASEGAKQLLNAIFDFSTSYKPEQVIPLPVTAHDKLTLTKDGPGRLYYTSLITYFRHMLPGDRSVAKGLPEGLNIVRKFYRMTPIATTTDGVVHFRTDEITDGHVKAGETIMMKILVEAPVDMPYVKVEAMLPSGAEVVDDSRQNSTETSSDDTMKGDWGSAWWSHQDILDDRIVYFGTRVQHGKSEFHTMLRMELPGTLQINPVSLEGMYSDKIKGYSMLDSLQVTE